MRMTPRMLTAAATMLIAVTMILSGCATGPVHFQRKQSASETFEQFWVLNDHQYYRFGRNHSPLALVAIQSGYRMVSPKWTPIDVDPEVIRVLVQKMLNQPGAEYNTEPNGAVILNDSGKTIGYWYSIWDLPVLRFTAEKEFTISDPATRYPHTNSSPRWR